MKIGKIKKVLKDPKSFLVKINYRYPYIFKWMDDKTCIKFWFRYCIGHKLNLENPKTFNERLQYLKLYDRNPLYATLVDKHAVKKHIADAIGEEYVIPTLGVWDSFEEIDFDRLPNRFVLKCTHDSGGSVICKDKSILSISAARRKINRCMKRNFYWVGREFPYKAIKPRIIAEQYLEDSKGGQDDAQASKEELTDYKCMCFDGRVYCIFTCTDRYAADGLKVTFFDREWNKLPFARHYPASKKHIYPPVNLTEMIRLAEILARKLPFVRVDFYEVAGKLFFGELTFYPGGGLEEFEPEVWDEKLGKLIKIGNVEVPVECDEYAL